MFCPKCSAENEDTAKFCIHCGQPLLASVPAPRRQRRWLLALGLGTLLLLVVAGTVVAYLRLVAPTGRPVPTSEPTQVRDTSTPAAAATVVTGPGGVRLEFAPEAAIDVSSVTIRQVVDHPPPDEDMILVSPVFEIAGSDAILSAPARLTLPLAPEALAQRDERSMLAVAWWNGSQWLPMGGQVNELQQTISVETQHLSLFMVVLLALCAPVQETDHFEIIPWNCPNDYSVDDLAQESENAWKLVIDDLEYEVPRQIERGDKVEVWICDIESLGVSRPTFGEALLPGYLNYSIYIDPGVTITMTKVVPAHEFFHVVQVNSYLHPSRGLMWSPKDLERRLRPLRWWMEATATWIGAKALDEEWEEHRTYYRAQPESILARSLDDQADIHMYRAGSFVRFLQDEHGAGLIRESWASLTIGDVALPIVDETLRKAGSSLGQAYWDFAQQYGYLRESGWLQQTMDLPSRQPEPKATQVQVRAGRQKRTVQRPHLSAEVWELLPAEQGTLELRFDWGAHGDVWRVALYAEKHDGSAESFEIASPQREIERLHLGTEIKRLIVVAANTSLDRDDATLSIDLQLVTPTPTPTVTLAPSPTPSPPPLEIAPPGRNVELVGHIGGATAAVAVHGHYAYVGEGPQLTVLDVSDPNLPRVVGKSPPLPQVVEYIAVTQDYCYVLAGGLWVVDVANPSEPMVVGHAEVSGEALDVAASYAYVIDPESGLRAVDITDPTHPREVGSCDTPGTGSGVAIAGSYAYVADGEGGLRIVDIADPVQLHEVGFYDTPGFANSVVLVGDYAYVADGSTGLRILNISNPALPREMGFYDTPGYAQSVAVMGDYAYLAGREAGLRVVDVSDPAQPWEVGYCDTADYAWDIAVAGSHAYVADWQGGLRAVDISSPAQPHEVGLYETPGAAHGLAIAGNYAYIGYGPPSLQVMDISDPSHPREVGRTDLPLRGGDERLAYVCDVAVHGTYAYVTVWAQGLWVVDVSTPSAPRQVGFYETPGLLLNVFISDSHAYIATGSGLSIVDVSDPTKPRQVAYYATEGVYRGDGIGDVYLSGRYAYLAHYYYGLIVLDVSDPTNPRWVGGSETPGGDVGVTVSDSMAYLISTFDCDGSHDYDGLRVYDVTRPDDPQEVSSLDAGYRIGGNWDVPIVASDSYLYLATYDGGLRVIDASDPARPREAGFYNAAGEAGDVTVSGGYVYLASGAGGLYVLRFVGQPATQPQPARTLAFLLDYDLWTIKEDGTDLRQLTTTGTVSAFSWSPDGREIAYLADDKSDTDLYIMDAAGSDVRQLTHGSRAIGRALDWHGSRIAFVRWTGSLWTYKIAFVDRADASATIVDTSPDVQIEPMGGNLTRDPRVRWSPDGRWIALSEGTAMGVAAADGSSFHPVHLLHPEWKSDSSHILHTSYDPPGGIWVFDPRTNSQSKLSDVDADYAVYSPDAQSVAYADGSRLGLMNADGTGHRTLVDGRAADLAWSPDGAKIAYASWEPSELAHSDYYTGLHLVKADGSGHVELVTGFAHHPAWQPD